MVPKSLLGRKEAQSEVVVKAVAWQPGQALLPAVAAVAAVARSYRWGGLGGFVSHNPVDYKMYLKECHWPEPVVEVVLRRIRSVHQIEAVFVAADELMVGFAGNPDRAVVDTGGIGEKGTVVVAAAVDTETAGRTLLPTSLGPLGQTHRVRYQTKDWALCTRR